MKRLILCLLFLFITSPSFAAPIVLKDTTGNDVGVTGNPIIVSVEGDVTLENDETISNDTDGEVTVDGHFILEQAGDGRTSGISDTDSHLRVYSSDESEANDYIEMYHNQSGGIISSGGNILIENVGIIEFDSTSFRLDEYLKDNNIVVMQNYYDKDSQEIKYGLDDDGGNQLVITNRTNLSSDHDHAARTDPTLFIHSDKDPDTANDEWIGLSNNKTNSQIQTGSGGIQRVPNNDITHGGYIEQIFHATSGTLTGTTDTIELAIPSDWRITQCQLHVLTAVSDDAGDDTWSSELNDGAQEEVISAGSAAAQNTNVNHWANADTWGTLTDAETDILLTPNGGNFDGGEIEAHCTAQGFDAWDSE